MCPTIGRNLSERLPTAWLERSTLLVEQPAVISAMALIIKTRVAFVMRPFAVETVLCRV